MYFFLALNKASLLYYRLLTLNKKSIYPSEPAQARQGSTIVMRYRCYTHCFPLTLSISNVSVIGRLEAPVSRKVLNV